MEKTGTLDAEDVMIAETVHLPAAFAAGVLSFFSPCILPLLPAYFSFITGYSIEELAEGEGAGFRTQVIFSTTTYVLGFTLVFVLMGASASWIGNLLYDYRDPIRIVGGALIILLGVHMTGWIRFDLLHRERRVHVHRRPLHIAGPFFVGMAFAAGWSPCIGPLLGSILIIAGAQNTVWQGMGLLAVYSLGLALPFLMLSVGINYLFAFLQHARKLLRYMNVAIGAVLIVTGLLLITDKLTLISSIAG